MNDNKTSKPKKEPVRPPKAKYPQPKSLKFNLNSGAIKTIRKAAARGR